MSSVVAGKSAAALRPRLYSVVILGLVIVLIGSGLALLWSNSHMDRGRAQAADVSVVGAPTLAASTIDGIFARVGSPMQGLGALIEQMSRQDGIDDAFALGVWWTETNDGEAGVGLADRNPGSVRGSVGYPSAWDGYTIYPSYSAAVVYWFNMLRTRYVDEGLSTVYVIARPYVGTTSYPLWAAKVINLMYSYRGLAPPPPVSTPKPKPTVDPAVLAAKAAWRSKLTLVLKHLTKPDQIPLPRQGITLESVPANPVPAPETPSSEVVSMMIALGLLMAIVFALFALKLRAVALTRRSRIAVGPSMTPWTKDIVTEPLAMPAPLRITLPATPMPRLPVQASAGYGSPRRVTLRPAAADARTPELAVAGASRRPGGLLSRYGQSSAGSAI